MTVTTSKITESVANGLGAAREVFDTKFMPVAVPAGRKAAQVASEQAVKQLHQAREFVEEKLAPMAATKLDEARIASAPIRAEAARRGKLAAAALRGAESIEIRRRRRWPLAFLTLALGGLIGAAAAWLAQAGKPVQLTPYPLPGEQSERLEHDGPQTVDLSDGEAHEESQDESHDEA